MVQVALQWAARAHQWLLTARRAHPDTFPIYFIPTYVQEKEETGYNVFLTSDRRTYVWVVPDTPERPVFVVLHYVDREGQDKSTEWSEEGLEELRALDPKPTA